MAEFKPIFKVIDNFDFVIEESQNQFSAFRKVAWGEDESKAKYEIRKWRNSPDGSEVPAKGFTFMTDEGPDELLYIMLEQGFGDPKRIMDILKNRNDIDKDSIAVSAFFDPSQMVKEIA
jgi:hypothetical protein